MLAPMDRVPNYRPAPPEPNPPQNYKPEKGLFGPLGFFIYLIVLILLPLFKTRITYFIDKKFRINFNITILFSSRQTQTGTRKDGT